MLGGRTRGGFVCERLASCLSSVRLSQIREELNYRQVLVTYLWLKSPIENPPGSARKLSQPATTVHFSLASLSHPLVLVLLSEHFA